MASSAALDSDVVEIAVRPRRRRLLVLLLLCALVVVAGLLLVAHRTSADPSPAGYPQRIGFDRPSDQLPARVGPLAATMYDNDFGAGRALGVTSGGRLWELPDGATMLSPSGTRLFVDPWGESRRPFVRDLATGDRRVLADPGVFLSLGSSTGVRWSPDETALLTTERQAGRAPRRRAVVVEIASGRVSPVGAGAVAGFRSAAEVVTVRIGARADVVVARTTDVDTGTVRDLRLRLDAPWRSDPDGEMAASVAPDGRTLLLVEVAEARSSDATVRLFSLADGSELPSRSVRDWDGCAPGWIGDDPVLPTSSVVHGGSRAATAVRLTDRGPEPLVAVHPRLQSSCLQLTAAALEAGPRWSLFGASTALWTWYWFPALAAVVLAALGVLVLVRTAARVIRAEAGRR